MHRRTYEFCVPAEPRDQLRAGEMWVEGSRSYRAVEQQLIPVPVFAAIGGRHIKGGTDIRRR